MRILCAWHYENFGFDRYMGNKEPFNSEDITTSICDDCRQLLFIEEEMENFAISAEEKFEKYEELRGLNV